MKEKGMGRTRLGRFAAVTVPATAASLGLGFAIVTGMVSASVSSAGGFQVGGDAARADGMKMSLASTDVAQNEADATGQASEAALVTLEDGYLDGMCLAVNQSLPVIGQVSLTLGVPTGTVGVGTIDLNASQVNTGTANLPSTTIGVAAGETGQNVAASNVGGFGLKTNDTTGVEGTDEAAASAVKLADLNATAYQLTLNNGLDVGSLEIGVSRSTASC